VTTIREAIEIGRDRLRAAAIDSPGREAALLLGSLLGMSEAALLAQDDRSLSAGELGRFLDLIERRRRHEPAAYLVGRREFWGRSFRVDPRVLIPRPESEELVELALGLDLPECARIVDLGTGSGCLAVTLSLERPQWSVVGADFSVAALALARANALQLGACNVGWLAADLTDGFDLGAFDLLIANLPYVDRADSSALAPELGYEPDSALFAEDAGLATIRRLLARTEALRPGARIALEVGATQARELAASAGAGGLELVEIRRDAAEIERVVLWRRAA
jgi:release factor glutamine methyltransferase